MTPEGDEDMSSIDTVIRGGKLVDGTGAPWLFSDVALSGDRVVEVAPVGHISPERARDVVDATGMVVCPGFIDIQSHSHMPLMIDGRSLSKITQGVTTEIMGEGWTPAPFGGKRDDPFTHSLFSQRIPEWQERARSWTRFRDWLDAMIEHGVSPNIGSFLGGGTLRAYAKGLEMGPPTDEEMATMRQVMRQAMEDGAFGVAYALIYPPDAYASSEEIVRVCRVVGEYGGIYITHIRSEAEALIDAVAEAVEIGRRAELPVEIYHLKASGRANWHRMSQAIALINSARAEGVDVTADMYPYTASGTGLTAVLPPWAAAGSGYFENLHDPQLRDRIRAEVLNPSGEWEVSGDGPETVMPIGFQKPENLDYVGKRLDEIATSRGEEWVDTVMNLLLSEEQRISTIYFTMQEENLRLQLQQPWIKVSTDAGGFDPEWAKELGPYHPRAYGTYPRVLGKFVREDRVITLEDAVYKMTWAVASRLGLRDRGQLCEGFFADVTVFDSQTVGDRATFEDPHQLSVGVRDVWVNGVRVLQDGTHTGATPGRIVDGPGRS
jgi:dihydroorotase/N-acyl-D-amino-acid deacylase